MSVCRFSATTVRPAKLLSVTGVTTKPVTTTAGLGPRPSGSRVSVKLFAETPVTFSLKVTVTLPAFVIKLLMTVAGVIVTLGANVSAPRTQLTLALVASSELFSMSRILTRVATPLMSTLADGLTVRTYWPLVSVTLVRPVFVTPAAMFAVFSIL